MSLSSLHDAIDNWGLNSDRPFSLKPTRLKGTIEGLDFQGQTSKRHFFYQN